MNELKQKLEHLKWLHSAGIEYYCSTKKDSKNCLFEAIKKHKYAPFSQDDDANNKLEPVITMDNNVHNSNMHPQPTNYSEAQVSSRQLADLAKTLAQLRQTVENFNGCELKQFANNTVFSDGQAEAKILLVGEAPGASEDEQGIPFCGDSGKLLDAMLSAIDISRTTNAYITNTVFWRPPANRRPTTEEIEICKPFVEKHIALINPKLIIVVGATAASSLLQTNEGMSYIRQNNYYYTNEYLKEPILTTALFHPAYLLRQPTQKKATWFDLLKIQNLAKELINIH